MYIDVCRSCKCDRCTNSVDDQYSREGDFSCFNCDECYNYGRDDASLSDNHKRECSKFKMSKADIDRRAKLNRKEIKLLKP